MAVRFYVDADTLGLAHVMVALRWDVTYPGDPGGTVKRHPRPPCPITATDVDDQGLDSNRRLAWMDDCLPRHPHREAAGGDGGGEGQRRETNYIV